MSFSHPASTIYTQEEMMKIDNQGHVFSINSAQINMDFLLKYYFQKFSNEYQMEGIMSRAPTELILQATQKNSQITYEIKIIPNSSLKYKQSRIKTWLKILGSLHSDRCIKLIQSNIEEKCIYIVMDYMKFGTLHSFLLRQEQRLQENIIKQIMLSLFQGVLYIHSIGILHRDLKPQNILIRDQAQLDLVIGNFEQADYCTKYGLKSRCGSVGFMAPEMLNGEFYDFKADVYSLGAICFFLFHGTEIRQAWDSGCIQVSPQMSEEAQDFLNKCTETNPNKRITVKEALGHHWFNANIVDFNVLENKKNKCPANTTNNDIFWMVNEEDSANQVIPNFASMITTMKK